jgi:DNA (cytosine-5)-methyltransferase 1
MIKRPTVISIFSGCGGLDLGFKRAGFDILWANDVWNDACETYKLNFGDHIICDNLEHIDSDNIPYGDVLIGGFPCQGFSTANMTRHVGDWRNQLYKQFLRVLNDKKPLLFVAENVKGILSLGGGKVFEEIMKDFSESDYYVQHALLNAANYGVPQRRERVFIIGVRKNFQSQLLFPPAPTHYKPTETKELLLENSNLLEWIGIGEALKDIPEPEHDHNLENHEASKYKLRFNGYLGHRKIDPQKPCPTITARGDDKGGVVIHHHPSNKRRLTAREAALIQAFPLDFKFYGTKTSVYRQVANAVAPMLAERIASNLLEVFQIEYDKSTRKAV